MSETDKTIYYKGFNGFLTNDVNPYMFNSKKYALWHRGYVDSFSNYMFQTYGV